MRRVSAYFLALFIATSSAASPAMVLRSVATPNDSIQLLPTVKEEINRSWNDLQPREFIPALIEQESLFKTGAKLQTAREFGCGLGQFTKAYNADGTVRFDALEEAKRLDPSLANWSWRDCYNASYQIRAVVLKLRANDRSCSAFMLDSINAKACAAAQYNGGAGSVSKRVRLCRMTTGCKPDVWSSNLDGQCPQARVKVAGYGESFCEINSKYPQRVFDRMPKYKGKV